MRVLVAYTSQTGNTKKVAEVMYGEIGTDKAITTFPEVSNLDGCDLTFIGFPIQQFGVPQEVQTFLQAHTAGKRIALFMTHAAPEGSDHAAGYLAQARQLASGADVIGIFDCQGELPLPVKQYLLNSGNPQFRAWAEGDSSQGQPDATRLERARAFAREVMTQVTQLVPSH